MFTHSNHYYLYIMENLKNIILHSIMLYMMMIRVTETKPVVGRKDKMPSANQQYIKDISLSDMQIQETFSLIDMDGDNTIKRDELNGFMTNVDAENFIMTEDVDHNGIIGFDEFLRWAKGLALEELTRKNVALEVKQVFNLMDSDNDGFLSLQDLQILIANTDEVKQMINEQDIDMDGRINYSEFALLMNS